MNHETLTLNHLSQLTKRNQVVVKLEKANIMSTRSLELETEHDEEISSSSCSCSFMGFKRSQVFDYSLSGGSEIGDEDSEELFEINLKETLYTIREDCESSVFSLDIHKEKDVVYVAVGRHGDSNSSVEALLWALKHAVTPSSTTVCLIHVFPQIKFIPSPLGKIPRSHVNPEHVDMYLTQEKGKRKLLLQKFIDLCVDSKVKVEMMLIEGDNVAKTIVDLVGNLNIRKLVIGTTKSNLRKSGSKRGNAIAENVLKKAQESCDVKIICEGIEVIDQIIDCTSPCSTDSSSSRVSHEKEALKRFIPSPFWLFRSRFLSPKKVFYLE